MSFLTPLYLLGLAAVSLPVIFHLIRRTPRGRFAFSSLMFLSPSPPRLTRRSRLDNILLLLLRAAVLILLAAAFARPFLRSIASTSLGDYADRKIAIVVDTSASMQRDDLWSQVTQKVDQVLDDLEPGDDVALYRFAGERETIIALDDISPADPRTKISRVRTAFQSLNPGWGSSNLGDVLVAVADEVDRAGTAREDGAATTRQVVLISDLQEGVRLEALRNYTWPDDVQLIVQTVSTTATTNAGLQPAPNAEASLDQPMRVRVNNSGDSIAEQFRLRWEDDSGKPASESVSVYVPAGESRIVRVSAPPTDSDASRLVLSGDDHDFDNTLYRVPEVRDTVQVIYLGNDQADDPQGQRYYLTRAFPGTKLRSITVTSGRADQAIAADQLDEARMVVLHGTPLPENVDLLRGYADGGGTLLVVLTDVADATGLTAVLRREMLEIGEAEIDDYALLGQIDFSDPLFAPFADPRYNDFTTIHFWRHRRFSLPEDLPAKVLARFDDGDPALIEFPFEKGSLLVLTAGWHPRDSQLSRSTKFVPLLAGLLERNGGSTTVSAGYEVGQTVNLPRSTENLSIQSPDGATLKLAASAKLFDATNLPGIYVLSTEDRQQQFAVNVPARESNTTTLSIDQLQQQGVTLATATTRSERADRLRQMRDVELEGRQKLWRWLIVAALGLLILETWLAGYLTRAAIEPVGSA